MKTLPKKFRQGILGVQFTSSMVCRCVITMEPVEVFQALDYACHMFNHFLQNDLYDQLDEISNEIRSFSDEQVWLDSVCIIMLLSSLMHSYCVKIFAIYLNSWYVCCRDYHLATCVCMSIDVIETNIHTAAWLTFCKYLQHAASVVYLCMCNSFSSLKIYLNVLCVGVPIWQSVCKAGWD